MPIDNYIYEYDCQILILEKKKKKGKNNDKMNYRGSGHLEHRFSFLQHDIPVCLSKKSSERALHLNILAFCSNWIKTQYISLFGVMQSYHNSIFLGQSFLI